MLTPNQASKLVAKGRMKSIGESWTEEEAVAINNEKDPAKKEALIAKFRGGKAEKVKELSDKVLTPEEIEAEKEKVKADKKAQAEAKKAEAKAKKEAEKK